MPVSGVETIEDIQIATAGAETLKSRREMVDWSVGPSQNEITRVSRTTITVAAAGRTLGQLQIRMSRTPRAWPGLLEFGP